MATLYLLFVEMTVYGIALISAMTDIEQIARRQRDPAMVKETS